MRCGSLFSGIGGFDLGLNFPVSWQVELDKGCNRVLAYHFPETERFTDVKEVGKNNLAAVDLICGGFPCQDLSVAGKRAGLDGERSGLWFEFHRIIRELRPRWVLIENVPGLLSSNGGRDFAVILSGLGELGYFTAWRVLDSQWFGVAQRRRRVFIVASLGDGRCAEVLFEPSCGCGDTPPCRETGTGTAASVARSLGRVGGGDDYGANKGTLAITGTLRGGECGGKRHGKPGGFDQEFVIPVPDPAYAIQGQGSRFGSGRERQDTFVVGFKSGQSAQARSLGIEEELSPSLEGGGGGNNKPCVAFAYDGLNQQINEEINPALRIGKDSGDCVAIPIDTRNATRTTEKSEMNRQGVGIGEDGDPCPTLTDMFTPCVAQQVQWASGGGEVLNDTAQALGSVLI